MSKQIEKQNERTKGKQGDTGVYMEIVCWDLIGFCVLKKMGSWSEEGERSAKMATGSGRLLANLSIMALLCFSRWREENRRKRAGIAALDGLVGGWKVMEGDRGREDVGHDLSSVGAYSEGDSSSSRLLLSSLASPTTAAALISSPFLWLDLYL